MTEAAAVREDGRDRAADEMTPFMNGRWVRVGMHMERRRRDPAGRVAVD